jgi:hypothetical protein
MRRVTVPLLLTLAMAVCCGGTAAANDTYAELTPGGLRFAKTDEIRMESEELVLGTDEISVAYRFRNLTDHDLTLEVAFPLPDIDMGELSETPHEFHASAHPGDVFDFHLTVDGTPREIAFDVHAMAGDRDVTALLRRFHVPLVDAGAGPMQVMEKLGPAAIAALAAGGAVAADDPARHPGWVVKAAYHWTQLFPAGGTVAIAHNYKPVLGGGLRSATDLTTPGATDGLAARFCASAADEQAAARLPGHAVDNTMQAVGPLLMRWLGYILSTGANWAGPIGHFRLEIRQGAADLATTCPIPGLTLAHRDRSLAAEAEEFTPKSDIHVLYVYGYCSEQRCKKMPN